MTDKFKDIKNTPFQEGDAGRMPIWPIEYKNSAFTDKFQVSFLTAKFSYKAD